LLDDAERENKSRDEWNPPSLASRAAKSYNSPGLRREGTALTHSRNGSGCHPSRINNADAATRF
jgi:hypothetical protein